MAGRIALPPMSEERNSAVLPLGVVSRLLDTIEEPLMVAERSGNLLLVNTRARQCLGFHGYAEIQGLNLFNDILQVDSKKIFGELERGQHEVNLNIEGGEKKSSGCISEIAGSEPTEDGVPGVGGSRAENAAGGDQRLLRSSPCRFAGPLDGQAAGHSGGIEGQLRTAGASYFDVPELFRAGERQAGAATSRE